MAGIRPCTPLNPWDWDRKYVGVLAEHPIPESFATRWGGISSAQNASMIAAVTESCPHPAQSVEVVPS